MGNMIQRDSGERYAKWCPGCGKYFFDEEKYHAHECFRTEEAKKKVLEDKAEQVKKANIPGYITKAEQKQIEKTPPDAGFKEPDDAQNKRMKKIKMIEFLQERGYKNLQTEPAKKIREIYEKETTGK